MLMATQSINPNPPSGLSGVSPISASELSVPSLSAPGMNSGTSGLSTAGSMALGTGLGIVQEGLTGLINNLFARRNARINYEYQEKANEAEYQRQLDFWNMQNEYNTPAAQAARMRAAGLSPVDGVDSGNSSNLSTTPHNGMPYAGDFVPVSFDLMPVIEGFSRIQQMNFGNALTTAQTRKVVGSLYLDALEGELRKAGLPKVALEVRRLLDDNARAGEVHSKTMRLMDSNFVRALLENDKLSSEINTFKTTGYYPGTKSYPTGLAGFLLDLSKQLAQRMGLLNSKGQLFDEDGNPVIFDTLLGY